MGGSCDLLGDGRLLKRVELEGAGPSPQKGDRVQVRYETRHQGKCVESMAEEAFEFVLGEDQAPCAVFPKQDSASRKRSQI